MHKKLSRKNCQALIRGQPPGGLSAPWIRHCECLDLVVVVWRQLARLLQLHGGDDNGPAALNIGDAEYVVVGLHLRVVLHGAVNFPLLFQSDVRLT